ncbi:hypothetical protein EVAR_67545_1 [Eumeta japonica]|uniref:Uncharacterized protein n=1 Tax=Eumeta variegata TaxID=151549 RepID=A0A4C1ZWX1_EUMVA|nr:hypothetical protein EVAR_67545_1 [Eumeta japonica]
MTEERKNEKRMYIRNGMKMASCSEDTEGGVQVDASEVDTLVMAVNGVVGASVFKALGLRECSVLLLRVDSPQRKSVRTADQQATCPNHYLSVMPIFYHLLTSIPSREAEQ